MPSSPLNEKINKYLYPAETFFVGLLTVGILLPKFDINADEVIMISLSGLAVIFFLNAYRPLDVKMGQGDQFGFKEMLYLNIIPKVLWIACSIMTIGILFSILNTAGYKHMMIIGASTSVVALILLGIFFLTEEKHIRATIPILYRAIPLLLVSAYILFGQ